MQGVSSRAGEIVLQRLPTLVVVGRELVARLGGPFGDGHAERRLEHERHGTGGESDRLEVLFRGGLEAAEVGAVRCHHAVQ